MRARRISWYFAALSAGDCVRLLARVPRVLLRGTAADLGSRSRFEQQWCQRTGAVDAIATPSARSGLYALLCAFDIGPGDEILVTGFTCGAVPEPIIFRGARPVYVDIDPQTYGMDLAAAAAAITPRTRLLIVQHTFGFPAPMNQFLDLARRYGLRVIEDCALALGSRADGEWLGNRGDASVWSFELSKTLTVGWGGIVQINHDRGLAQRVRQTRDAAGALNRVVAARRLLQAGISGLLYRPSIIRTGGYAVALLFRLGLFKPSATRSGDAMPPPDYLSSPDDGQWAVLENQMTRLADVLEVSHHAAARYQAVLDQHGCGDVIPSAARSSVRLNRFPFVVVDRARFIATLAADGIEVGQWFSRPVSCSAPTAPEDYGYHAGDCPVAERVASHIVNLPLHARLNSADVEAIASCLDRYLDENTDERAFMARREIA